MEDNQKESLQAGIQLNSLGLLIQPNVEICPKFMSPFQDNPKAADPMNQSHTQHRIKSTQIMISKEFFMKFPEETHFYIFYNQMDEQRQLWAAEILCQKGWRYHYKQETWLRDLVPQGNGYFACKYFSIRDWGTLDISSIQLDVERDLCTYEDFVQSVQ